MPKDILGPSDNDVLELIRLGGATGQPNLAMDVLAAHDRVQGMIDRDVTNILQRWDNGEVTEPEYLGYLSVYPMLPPIEAARKRKKTPKA